MGTIWNKELKQLTQRGMIACNSTEEVREKLSCTISEKFASPTPKWTTNFHSCGLGSGRNRNEMVNGRQKDGSWKDSASLAPLELEAARLHVISRSQPQAETIKGKMMLVWLLLYIAS